MNKISLERVQTVDLCTHVKLLVNGNDVGILYLKEDEADILFKCLKRGSYQTETQLDSNIYEDDGDDDFTDDEEE